jgi:hypothetical protein
MSLFDCQAIPDYLLRGRYIEGLEGHIDFEEDVATLRAYHLIGPGISDNSFDMHRLVQFSTIGEVGNVQGALSKKLEVVKKMK